jgi:hypothetical protein
MDARSETGPLVRADPEAPTLASRIAAREELPQGIVDERGQPAAVAGREPLRFAKKPLSKLDRGPHAPKHQAVASYVNERQTVTPLR